MPHRWPPSRPPRSDTAAISAVTTAIIGTGGLGSAIVRRLASGGETLRLTSAGSHSAQALAAEIGPAAVVAADKTDALQGADAVILALRFVALKGVIDEIADSLDDNSWSFPATPSASTPRGTSSVCCRTGQSSGGVVAGWLPAGAHLAMAFGTMSAALLESSANRSPEPAVLFYATDEDRAGEGVERLIRTAGFEPVEIGGIEQSGSTGGRRRPPRTRGRSGRGAVFGRWHLILLP